MGFALKADVHLCLLITFVITVWCTPDPNGHNVCYRTHTFTEVYQKQCKSSYRSRRVTWCWDAWELFRCSEYTTRYRMVPCTATRAASKKEYFCCAGYSETSDHKCEPVCRSGCEHGRCIEPDKCFCYAGWRGDDCSSACRTGFWGEGCRSRCTCVNGGVCDPVTGICVCPAGYYGNSCENKCASGTYGLNCTQICRCQNGGTCHHVTGVCRCRPGYRGNDCSERCPSGFYGDGCKETCVCSENARSCHHVDGQCLCEPGYGGETCNETCQQWQFGVNCAQTCGCDRANSVGCDPADGRCRCKSGWYGSNCEGFSGENCNESCQGQKNVAEKLSMAEHPLFVPLLSASLVCVVAIACVSAALLIYFSRRKTPDSKDRTQKAADVATVEDCYASLELSDNSKTIASLVSKTDTYMSLPHGGDKEQQTSGRETTQEAAPEETPEGHLDTADQAKRD